MTPHVDIGADEPRRRPQTQTDLGLFAQPGGFVANAHGGPLGPVEHCQEMARLGFGWVVFNAFDGVVKPSDWTVWQREAMRARLRFGWWARCYSPNDLEFLAALATQDVSPLIVFNCEDELASGDVTVQDIQGVSAPLRAFGCDVGVSTVSPVYQDVAWGVLSRSGVVVLPQAFMNYQPSTTAVGAYEQAAAEGCSLLNITVGVNKTPLQPDGLLLEDYKPLPPAWSVYPVDSVDRWS